MRLMLLVANSRGDDMALLGTDALPNGVVLGADADQLALGFAGVADLVSVWPPAVMFPKNDPMGLAGRGARAGQSSRRRRAPTHMRRICRYVAGLVSCPTRGGRSMLGRFAWAGKTQRSVKKCARF